MQLQRTRWARVATGALFQPLLTILVLLVPLAILGAGERSDIGGVVRYTVLEAVLAWLWSYGLTARAEMDGEAVRWRYYRGHRVRWSEVEQVRLTFRRFSGMGGRHEIHLRAGGRDHLITPACGMGRGQRRFGLAVAEMARERGITTYVDWNPAYVRSE